MDERSRSRTCIALLVGLGCGLLTGPGPGPRAWAQSRAEAEVIQVVDRLFDAMAAGDTASLRRVFHPDARLFATDIDAVGNLPPATVENFVSIIGSSVETLRERAWAHRVRIEGNLATVWSRYDLHRGERFSHCGVDAFQLIRYPDGWKIVSIAYTRQEQDCERPPGG